MQTQRYVELGILLMSGRPKDICMWGWLIKYIAKIGRPKYTRIWKYSQRLADLHLENASPRSVDQVSGRCGSNHTLPKNEAVCYAGE